MSCCRLNLFATANPSCGGSSFKFGDQIAKGFLWVASAHQCFADEKTMEPTFAKTLQRLRILQSTLTNHHCVVGSVSNESAARFQGDLKRLEIAVVHADELGASIQRAAQLDGRMHFNECVEPELVFCNFPQITQRGVIQCSD